MLKELFKTNLNYELNNEQIALFDLYYNKLIEYNKHTNLTRITEKEDVFIKHFLDSVMLTKLIDFNTINNMCDMGSGAGFPAIPILILYPHLNLTLIDSQIKRVTFLNELKEVLNLNYNVVHERAEVYSLKNHLQYDLVTVRALTDLNKILEYGIPLLKEEGYLIAAKGLKYEEEILNSQNALKTLKSVIVKIDEFMLPNDSGFRANLLIKKNNHVKGYPRLYKDIIKKPL